MRPAPPPLAVQSFACAKCGAPLSVRAPGKTAVVACEYCGSIVDARDPGHQLLVAYEQKIPSKPTIPLGARGTLRGETWECLGYLRRRVVVEGTPYTWDEYLLWNPYRGYRWLTEYAHHWTWVKPTTSLPSRSGKDVNFLGHEYRRFQEAEAEIIYVLGEFYWKALRGDTARCIDYVCPPNLLSEEKTADEVTWSIGEYMEPAAVWQAFKLAGTPPEPRGIASAQPSPWEPLARPMQLVLAGLLAVGILIAGWDLLGARNARVLEESFTATAGEPERSRVSQVFAIPGGRGNLEVEVRTNLDNHWAYFDLALIEETTDTAFDFSREVEYYHGFEGGESWSEGSTSDSTILSALLGGSYYLRVEPETDAPALTYTIVATRGVPRPLFFAACWLLLFLPYAWFWSRQHAFEHARWMESDYG
ncbi:MAG: DUF4178 domain-containing protein [Planctomycetes bacterium]|nr:DUF4178 domain-containing protein [Planctomycetota bacterium]